MLYTHIYFCGKTIIMCVFGGGSCALRKAIVKVMPVARYRMDFSLHVVVVVDSICSSSSSSHLSSFHIKTSSQLCVNAMFICLCHGRCGATRWRWHKCLCVFAKGGAARRMAHLINIITQHHMKDNILCL